METYADEESCYRGHHPWKTTRTSELNSADIDEKIIRSYKLPFWLANLFANKGSTYTLQHIHASSEIRTQYPSVWAIALDGAEISI
jgi:hypothetical protein